MHRLLKVFSRIISSGTRAALSSGSIKPAQHGGRKWPI